MSSDRRWVLEVRGDTPDLTDAAAIFTEGVDPHLSKYEDGGQQFFGMTSAEFNSLAEAREVHEVGLRLLRIVNGILFLRDPQRRHLESGLVREQAENGGWNLSMMAGPAIFTMRIFAPTVTVSGQQPNIPPYAKWTAAASSAERVAEVLGYLSGEPDWFDLYNAFEMMRCDINDRFGQHQYSQAGWPEKAPHLDFFTESATVYRHSSKKWGRYNPRTAMTLKDAREFVRQLATSWLQKFHT